MAAPKKIGQPAGGCPMVAFEMAVRTYFFFFFFAVFFAMIHLSIRFELLGPGEAVDGL